MHIFTMLTKTWRVVTLWFYHPYKVVNMRFMTLYGIITGVSTEYSRARYDYATVTLHTTWHTSPLKIEISVLEWCGGRKERKLMLPTYWRLPLHLQSCTFWSVVLVSLVWIVYKFENNKFGILSHWTLDCNMIFEIRTSKSSITLKSVVRNQ